MSDKVAPFMHELCQMDRYGGRCTRLSHDQWEVLDVQQWTEEQTALLQARFPSLTARIVANRKSLSGFSIVLDAHSASHIWSALVVCAAMMAANAALASTIRMNL